MTLNFKYNWTEKNSFSLKTLMLIHLMIILGTFLINIWLIIIWVGLFH